MKDPNLFLCFQGDGPYWKDLVYIPAYPAGFSYAKWAFRYDQNRWVAATVEAEAERQQQKQIQIQGILGVRFHDQRPELLLPLRRIEVTWIDLSGGVTQFYFRVLALLDFSKFDSLDKACLVLPAEEIAPAGQVKAALAFHSQVEIDTLPWASEDTEDKAWSKLLDLIVANETVPLRPEVKFATYFRFSNVTEEKKGPLKASQLEVSYGKGPIYGALLQEGRDYQLKLTHRIFSSEHKGTAPILPLRLELPTTHLQLTEPSLEILGWYQVTPIVFRALRADQGHQILLVRSDKKREDPKTIGGWFRWLRGDASAEGAESDIYLPIPFLIKPNWPLRIRKNWVPKVWLAVVLTLQTSAVYLKDFIDKLLAGKASLSDLAGYWYIFLGLFVLGAIASILVTMLSGQVKTND